VQLFAHEPITSRLESEIETEALMEDGLL
jgi:hypothetical protein